MWLLYVFSSNKSFSFDITIEAQYSQNTVNTIDKTPEIKEVLLTSQTKVIK